MRFSHLIPSLVLVATLVCGSRAHAGSRDISLLGLGRPANNTVDDPATRRFRALANELALVTAPKAWTTAESLGASGFEIAFAIAYTGIASGADYWTGTAEAPIFEGAINGGGTPSGFWTPTLQVRKGLPFSTDLGVSVAYLANSSMVALGLDAKVALFESSLPDYLPDFALRGAVGHLVGAPELNQSTFEFDLMASRVFPIAQRLTLTPTAGIGLMWARTSSETINERPYETTANDAPVNDSASPLYTLPTQRFGANRFTRLWLGGRMVYGIMSVAYYLDLGLTPSGSDAHTLSATHALKLGIDI